MFTEIKVVPLDVARRLHATVPRSEHKLYVTPKVLEAFLAAANRHRPEYGFLGLGPAEAGGMDTVEFDVTGSRRASATVYAPDIGWANTRVEHWMAQRGDEQRVLHAIVHSHPGSSGLPSAEVGDGIGDMGHAKAMLRDNPTMDHFFLPVITHGRMGTIYLWPWVVERTSPDDVRYAEVVVGPVESFPDRVFNPAWLASLDPPAQSAPASESSQPSVREAHRATRGGDTRELSTERYYSRLNGVVSRSLRRKRILIVGCGGGSEMAVRLARQGPGELRLVDMDVVEIENLVRTAFGVDDLGRPKALALKDHIARANPFVAVTAHHRDITTVTAHEVEMLLDGVDLIIAGTDSFAAQALLNRWSVQWRIPAVFIGVHAKARGGIIIWSIPGKTACYRCVAASRYAAAESETVGRGQTLDLAGELGSAVDVALIDAVALKIVMGLLERGETSDLGSFIEASAHRTQVVVRTHPAYRWEDIDLFDLVLDDLPSEPKPFKQELVNEAFFACDSLWLRATRNPSCPDCSHLWHGAGGTDA